MKENNCYIEGIPEKSYIDEELDIKISGLPKHENVLVRAVSSDYYCINAGMSEQGKDSVWEAYGVFKADNNGIVQLKNAVPIEGTYKSCDSMGLFYSMVIKEFHEYNFSTKLEDIPEKRSYHIDFTVEIDNKVIASKRHTRMFCDERIKSKSVTENNIIARYFTHEKAEKRPAIIVVSGSEGRIEKAQAIAQVLASKGYSALAVCFFGLDGTSRNLDRIPLEIIENAIAWLKKQNTVDPNHIGIFGRSKGGELVVLAAANFKDITCVVANTPSCYVYEGLINNRPSHHSSWTYGGTEFPCLSFSASVILRMLIKKMFRQKNLITWMYQQIIQKGNSEKASIAVEKINGPILLLSSKSDATWPSLLHCEKIVERLCKKNFPFEVKHFTYEKSGHMLTMPYQSISSLTKCDGNLEEWRKACENSWKQTIDFLNNWGMPNAKLG